jgi:hypothetical protein
LRNLKKHFYKLKLPFQNIYKRFMVLDADTVLIGNVFKIPFSNYDMYVSGGPESVSHEKNKRRIDKLIFDCNLMKKYDQKFSFDRLITFNSGHFFCRNEIFSIEETLRAYEIVKRKNKDNPFRYYEQGILNYLFNKACQTGSYKLGHSFFAITPSWEAESKYPLINKNNVILDKNIDKYVVHYTSPTRRFFISRHRFAFILKEFNRQYHKKAGFDPWIKYSIKYSIRRILKKFKNFKI